MTSTRGDASPPPATRHQADPARVDQLDPVFEPPSRCRRSFVACTIGEGILRSGRCAAVHWLGGPAALGRSSGLGKRGARSGAGQEVHPRRLPARLRCHRRHRATALAAQVGQAARRHHGPRPTPGATAHAGPRPDRAARLAATPTGATGPPTAELPAPAPPTALHPTRRDRTPPAPAGSRCPHNQPPRRSSAEPAERMSGSEPPLCTGARSRRGGRRGGVRRGPSSTASDPTRAAAAATATSSQSTLSRTTVPPSTS